MIITKILIQLFLDYIFHKYIRSVVFEQLKTRHSNGGANVPANHHSKGFSVGSYMNLTKKITTQIKTSLFIANY